MKKPLFKYFSIDRAKQVLSDKTIRFTQPEYFNDAFELIPTLDIDKIKEYYCSQNEELNGLDSFTLGVVSTLYKDYLSVGSLCLSSNFDIPLMWGHYAEDYTGLVIGFDPEEGLLMDSPNREDIDNYCDFGPVEYSKNRFKFPNSRRTNKLDHMFHKDDAWKYENEWRIIRSLKTLENKGNDIFVSDFNPEAVRCVIFGPKTKASDIKQITDVLSKKEYHHVGTYISFLSDEKFEIDINYLTSTFSDEEELIYSKEEYLLRKFREKMMSKGQLFKAMEVIDPKTEFYSLKDNIDLFTNEIKCPPTS